MIQKIKINILKIIVGIKSTIKNWNKNPNLKSSKVSQEIKISGLIDKFSIIDRATAKKLNLKFYYTGKRCIHGHKSKRLTEKTTCYECKKIRKKKYEKKPKRRMIESLNKRLNIYLKTKKYKKTTSLRYLIGTSPDGLRKHIENQFDSNMNWDNYGSFWEVDHIVPISFFDPEKESHLRVALNYNNLQPLEKKLNHIKSNNFSQDDLDKLLEITGFELD